MKYCIRILWVLLFAKNALVAFTPTEDGMYAVFKTSKGEFTTRLEFEKVPLTVANFVGLAEGAIVWFDANERPTIKRFYDGLTFHRIVEGFVIQAGSPNGLGTDGPGYRIPDDMELALNYEDVGVLAMANSGPNTNGSQFFITLNNSSSLSTNRLYGKHSVFGKIVEGMEVVTAISQVSVDGSGKPEVDVMINEVEIVRQGEAALAFDATGWGVPGLRKVDTEFLITPSEQRLLFSRDLDLTYYVFASSDLLNWGEPAQLLPLEGRSGIAVQDLSFTESIKAGGSRFIQVGEKRPYKKSSVVGRTLTIQLSGNDPIEINLGTETTGSYTFGSINGTVDEYVWYPLGNKAQFAVDYSGNLQSMQIYLTFQQSNSGQIFAYIFEGINSNPGVSSGTFIFQ